MPRKYSFLPDDILRQAADASEQKKGSAGPSDGDQKPSGAGGKPQRGPFKRKRAGVVLTREEVKEIKKGRKLLRKEMRQRGIKSKREFELVAGSLGLYFDKRSGILGWLLHGRGLWALLGALLALLFLFFLFSLITLMRGRFTINLSDGMFKEGFVLSETEDFAVKAVSLMCEPATDVPCISIIQIDEDVNEIDGQHNSDYFAYTFYVRNEGESTVDYSWELELNDESKNLSTAAWIMLFQDDKMTFYAEENGSTGKQEALPAFDDNTRGYIQTPLIDYAAEPDVQYRVMTEKGGVTYYRLVPYGFESEQTVTSGVKYSVDPMEVHKYCVVIWLEGDDPDCTDELMGGHLGLDMQFRLLEEDEGEGAGTGSGSWWSMIWNSLKFWE